MRKSYLILLLMLFALSAVNLHSQEVLDDRVFEMVTDPIWTTPAKSQGWTGTCWCFSTTSLIESEAKRLSGKEFELSEIYTVYNMYYEKARRYLRLHGNNTFGQGGLSHDMLYSVPIYGMMRDSDYSGFVGEAKLHNHSLMFQEVKKALDSWLENWRKEPQTNWRSQLNTILEKYIGSPPAEIEYEGETISPLEFTEDVLKFDADDYVEITSYKHLPLNARGELLVPDNWMRNENYYNVSLDCFICTLDYALKNGYSVVSDLDVGEPTQHKDGWYYTPHDLKGTKVTEDEREEMFFSWSTTDDHLVHTVGIAKDQDGRKYYYTKDSGGPDRYKFDGFYYISENYIRAKVLAFLVHKDGIPDHLKKDLGIE